MPLFKRTPKLAVSMLFILSGGLFGVWASRIPAVADFHDLSASELGLLLLVMAMGAIISFPFSGWSADRYGAKLVCFISAIIYVIAMICLGFSPNIPCAVIALFLFGAGHGSCDVSMNIWATEVEDDLQKPIMPFFHAMFSLGAGIGVATGYFAVTANVGYGLHFTVSSVCLGLITWYCIAIPYDVKTVDSDEKKPFFQLPKGALMLVGLIAFCTSIGEGAATDWSAILLIELKDANEAQATFGYGAFAVTMVFFRLIGQGLTQKFGPVLIAQVSGILAVAGIAMIIVHGPFWMAVIGFGFMGFGYSLIFPLAFSRAGADPFMSKGAAISGVATLGYGGILLGPPLIGFLADLISLRVSFGVVGVLALGMVLLAKNLALPEKTTQKD